jgi:hypothetical protein
MMNNTNRKYLVEGVATVRLPKVTRYLDSAGNELIPVVRCKDCIHSGQCTKEIVMRMRVGSYTYCPMGSDGFCSWGERKEDAETD